MKVKHVLEESDAYRYVTLEIIYAFFYVVFMLSLDDFSCLDPV